jgi:hypothetical protein
MDGKRHGARASVARRVHSRIAQGGEHFWTLRDFRELPANAVAMALSRLAKKGVVQRVRKGLYYRPGSTALGPTLPSQPEIVRHIFTAPLHPSGLTAANYLGFSTQNVPYGEFATPAWNAPHLSAARIHKRRPPSRAHVSEKDGALLEFLRDRARWSDFSPEETRSRLLGLLRQSNTTGLLEAARHEPPRVRAMLGALGEELRLSKSKLERLRKTLNPLSRFDFGPLRGLKSATRWQAA